VTVLGLGTARVASVMLSRRKQRELQSRSLEVQSRSTGFQMEMLGNMEALKAIGAEQRAAEQYSNVYIESLNVELEQGRLAAKLEASMTGFDMLSPLAVLSLGAYEVMAGNMSLGSMLALNALAAAFLSPLSTLVTSLLGMQRLGSYVERINEVFDTPREQAGATVRSAPPLDGRIQLFDLSFQYSPTGPFVVKGVSVDIEPGECVAIVGRSGSGKTTLGRLIVGLFKPTSGKICFQGIDLETLDYRSVRRQLGVVMQRPSLLTGTVRQNIAYGRDDLTLDAIMDAAKLAAVHDDIVALPLAYETPLLADGTSLSGGQKQRLVIARALARKPPVLLLDEATSSLDALTERRVHDALARLRCTRIIIAHRLSTIQGADRILMMHEGEVVESGTHAELLAKRGAYADLVGAQLAQPGAT
jgi:ATP-binding cassette subfamily B protein